MPNRSVDSLFQLIRSLQKGEKRSFKLYVKRNSSNEDLKMIQLFDALDKMAEYDEGTLLKKIPSIKKQQLSNIKAHLYKQILVSLRLLRNDENIDIQLHEQLDFAKILYNKGLYLQSLKILEKTKEVARHYNQDSFLIQIISLEKKIETLYITRSMQNRAEVLSAEADEVAEKRKRITDLSNLTLQLYSWYINNGHARNEKDEEGVKTFFKQHFPKVISLHPGFYENLYLCQCYCWYAFIRQDFLMYYKYTQKWVDLFHEQSHMLPVETGHYIKGLHNLLNALFDLRHYQKFESTLEAFEKFSRSEVANVNDNNHIQTFVYLNTARINHHFMVGTFKQGLVLVPQIEEKLEEYALYLDRHRVLVFYYKIASLYFGSGDYETCIDYVQKIINWKVDLRNDLQCYARLLHLMAHYELGNFSIIEYLARSVYRFMSKMETLTVVDEEIFRFLRNRFNPATKGLQKEFTDLLQRIKGLEKNRFETRAFAYLDVLSWLESKVYHKPMAVIVQEKYLQSKRRA
ncbi:hypothetical protein FSB75_04685 [Flavisolibacter ginsenosidimutans]|uniref:Tetratricopeptide repeat protein n=2 Tax=Flavisolibacter ginsenosidimutans TaxID=661481 RepID=A0A5B8UGH0_9BACT|nr:hypothetical protein FSB75_04685 [Flavisolibacter ginsenosidimutans]